MQQKTIIKKSIKTAIFIKSTKYLNVTSIPFIETQLPIIYIM